MIDPHDLTGCYAVHALDPAERTDFDYAARPETKLEIPLAERIAQIRAKKAEDRERSRAKAARRHSL